MWKILILLICSYTTFAVAEDCSIILPDDIKALAPVILTSRNGIDFELFKPTGKITTLKEGSYLMLVCTGKGNVFDKTTFNTLQLKCSEGKFVDEKKNVLTLKELVCKSMPSSVMRETKKTCSNGNGLLYETGFQIGCNYYGPVFEICYSSKTRKTLYSSGILNGAAMDYAISVSARRAFTAVGMPFTTTELNAFYTQKNQIKRFVDLFGATQPYINVQHFFARGHLFADADLIFGYEKFSTFYYMNAGPEAQFANIGNWLRVEELARRAAALYKDDIESYNGYFGILELPNHDGKFLPIYLDDNKQFAVPQYFWKVLYHRRSGSAIAFCTHNNVYKGTHSANEFCTNVCKNSGLIHPNFPDEATGYTFCCKLDEFKVVVDSLPDDVQASKLLTI